MSFKRLVFFPHISNIHQNRNENKKVKPEIKPTKSRLNDRLLYRLNNTISRLIEIFVDSIAILMFFFFISVLINNWKRNVPSGIP